MSKHSLTAPPQNDCKLQKLRCEIYLPQYRSVSKDTAVTAVNSERWKMHRCKPL
jgi:hypothetical protein